MKRNLNAEITDLDGKPVEPKLTLKDICLAACVANTQPDPSQEQKVALWKLAKKVHASGVVDFTAEEITTLKSRISLIYSVMATGRAFELLETDYVPGPV